MKYDTTKPNESSTNKTDNSELDDDDGTDQGMYSTERFKKIVIKISSC